MATTDAATRLPRALKPFADGQYRLLIVALTFSLFSGGCWLVASVWQVVQLGGSPVDLSLVAVGASVGLVLAVLFGGVAADRIPQRRILLACESLRGLAFAAAAVLALTGTIEIWHLAVIAFVLGVADGFFYPAYSAWLPSIIPADATARRQRHRGGAAPGRHERRRSGGRQRAHRHLRAGAGLPRDRRAAGRRCRLAVPHAHDAGASRPRRERADAAPPRRDLPRPAVAASATW